MLTLWKIHILHHAGEEKGIYGQWMLDELREHGYRLSPGTLYPLLSRMAARGWLKVAESTPAKAARIYRLTLAGQKVLLRLRTSVGELHREVVAPYAKARKPAAPKAKRIRSPR